MAHRIEVALEEPVTDAHGEYLRRRMLAEIGIELERVSCVDVYTIDARIDRDALLDIAGAPLCDPVIQRSCVDEPVSGRFDWAVEVAFRPGVTDNIGRTAREAIELVLRRKLTPDEGAYHARQYRLTGNIELQAVEQLADSLLANRLIQRWRLLDWNTFQAQAGFPPEVPRVTGAGRANLEEVSLELDDDSLVSLSRARVLALNLVEMKAIRDYFRREDVRAARRAEGLGTNPTDVELEALAQTWSEHCKHKIFNARIRYQENESPPESIESLFDTYIRGATRLVREKKGPADLCQSVFVDNAGVIRFNDDWSLVFKVETHNSPSALDPYGGALTGIVGVNRDPFGTGQGARLIFNTDVFCFASPFQAEPVPEGLLHPRRILEGVREGVEHGGNKSGIPTVNGSVVFEQRYLGKPLVFCGTGGLLPARIHGQPGWEKQVLPGDHIIMVGGRIGKDGIHGATFSSEELHEGSPSTAVQIGDPITQKRMTDFLLQARDKGLYRAITDNGAGGLSSSVGEMAQGSGGCELDLTNAPLKYEGLAAWEIFLSEAQERMTLAVAPEQLTPFMELASHHGVEATEMGLFTDSGVLKIVDQGRCVALMDMAFLHDGLPVMELEARWARPTGSERHPDPPADHNEILLGLLGRLNVCSKEYWVRQYDHEVQAGSVVKPLCGALDDGPSDAAVIRPLLDSFQAVAISHGICPRYSDLDTYAMAANAVDEAVRNAVAVGADPDRMAGLDNFCWCDPVLGPNNPDGDVKLGQLVRANRGLFDTCVAYGIPCISGKDSMKNDAVVAGRRISIPPTLLFSLLGLMDDARQAVTMDAKRAGDRIYLLGWTRDEMGASEYFQECNAVSNRVPQVRVEESLPMYRALHEAMRAGSVNACHDCSDGGLAVALAEMALAGNLGMAVDLRAVLAKDLGREDGLLYSESAGRLVATVPQDRAADFEAHLAGMPCACLGTVKAEPRLRMNGLSGQELIDLPIDRLRKAWIEPLSFT